MRVENLRVYNQALDACVDVEKIVVKLPNELFDTKRQVLRSSKAVPPLLSEGMGRNCSQRDFRHFVVEAMGSSDETITHLIIIKQSIFCNVEAAEIDRVITNYQSISKQLNTLVQSINNNIQNPIPKI